MTTRVAINGFGRIGRQFLKAALERQPDLEIVAVNDLADPQMNAFLFKHDTNYGTFQGEVSATADEIVIDGHHIKVVQEKDPSKLPWRDLRIDIVIESTGFFTDATKAKAHLDAGARYVIISAPAKNEDKTIVLGVNEGDFDPEKHHIISNASCTTNGLAPVAKVLNDEFGIVKGKFTGMAFRVPTPTVSVVDFVATLKRAVTKDEVNAAFKRAASGKLKGIMAYTEEPLVSSDLKGDEHSTIVSGMDTIVLEDMVKVIAWYDNEWGYACRLADITALVGSKVGAPTREPVGARA